MALKINYQKTKVALKEFGFFGKNSFIFCLLVFEKSQQKQPNLQQQKNNNNNPIFGN